MQLNDVLRKHEDWLVDISIRQRADFRSANLRYANLRGVDLRYADLRGVDLLGADLRGANLRYANLLGADLRGANLQGANLRYADLHGADLRDVDLRGVDLRDVELHGANLIGSSILTFQAGGHFAFYFENKVQIGCENHTLEYWLDNYEKIGTRASYSKQEISDYGDWLTWLFTREVINE